MRRNAPKNQTAMTVAGKSQIKRHEVNCILPSSFTGHLDEGGKGAVGAEGLRGAGGKGWERGRREEGRGGGQTVTNLRTGGRFYLESCTVTA